MNETTPCGQCYQHKVCERVGSPVSPITLEYDDYIFPVHHPEHCFFHCCVEGVEAGLKAKREAERSGTTGLAPFGTGDHKPHIEGLGRFVVVDDPGFGETGDVLVFLNERGPGYKVTNLLKLRPPK